MKKIFFLFIAFIITNMLAACRKNISCFNAQNYQLQFYTYSLADTIHDTGATIIKYGQGSNFLALVDSVPGIIILEDIPTYYTGRFAQQYISYTNYSSDIYTTDLLIILHPSGNIYKITNLTHDNRTLSEKSSENYACDDDITYRVNDSAYTCVGQLFEAGSISNAIMNIRY